MCEWTFNISYEFEGEEFDTTVDVEVTEEESEVLEGMSNMCYDFDSYEDALNDEEFIESLEDIDLESIDIDELYNRVYSCALEQIQEELEEEGLLEEDTGEGSEEVWEDACDECGSCDFAVESINGDILAYTNDFQERLYEKYLKENHLTKENVLEEWNHNGDHLRDLKNIGISIKDGKIYFENARNGYELVDLVENLMGVEKWVHPDSWKFERYGIWYIGNPNLPEYIESNEENIENRVSIEIHIG